MDGRSVTPAARFVRGWFCAGFATLFAAASHIVAGGVVPGLAVILSLSVGALVCVVLAGRRLSFVRVVCGVGVSQILFHTLFDVLAKAPGYSGAVSDHQHGLGSWSGAGVTHAASPIAGTGVEASMMVSHLVAGLLTIIAVRRGENLWWALLSILTTTVVAILRVCTLPPVGAINPRIPNRPAVNALEELLHLDARLQLRGPPRPALIVT